MADIQAKCKAVVNEEMEENFWATFFKFLRLLLRFLFVVTKFGYQSIKPRGPEQDAVTSRLQSIGSPSDSRRKLQDLLERLPESDAYTLVDVAEAFLNGTVDEV